MDLVSLISKSPELFAELKSIGLDSDQIVGVAGELNRQLRATEGPDLTDCLTGLNVQGFLEKLDVHELASRVDIDAALAGKAVSLVAPAVQVFDGDLGALLGKLTGGLLRDR